MYSNKRLMYFLLSGVLLGALFFAQLQLLGTSVYAEAVNEKEIESDAQGEKTPETPDSEQLTREDENSPIITFEDGAVEQITRAILKKPKGDITKEDVLSIKYFGDYPYDLEFESDYGLEEHEYEAYPYYDFINTLSDLKWFKNLSIISFAYNPRIEDISGIENLDKLEYICLESTGVENIEPLRNLKNLKRLNLGDCYISDISALEELTNIEMLDISNNEIKDITALDRLTNLKMLSISNNNYIWDITPLKNLTNLTNLSMESCHISDIAVLENMTNLTYLDLDNNYVNDISVLKNLENLDTLYLSGNNISDIMPIMDLPKLEYIYFSGNIIDESQIEQFQSKKIDLTDEYTIEKIGEGLPEIKALQSGFTFRHSNSTYIEKIIIKNAETDEEIQQIEIENKEDSRQNIIVSFEDANFDVIKDLCINRYSYFSSCEENNNNYDYYDYYIWDNKSSSFVYDEAISNLGKLGELYFDSEDNIVIVNLSENYDLSNDYSIAYAYGDAYKLIDGNYTKVSKVEIQSKGYTVDYELISKVVESPEKYKDAIYFTANKITIYDVNEETEKRTLKKEVYELKYYSEDDYDIIARLSTKNDKEIIDKYLAPATKNNILDSIKPNLLFPFAY